MANPNSDESILQGWDLDTHQRTPWTSMSQAEIAKFLAWHPTYMMSAKEASDWWGGVSDSIKVAKHAASVGDSPSNYRMDKDGGIRQVAQGANDYSIIGKNAYYMGELVGKDREEETK